MKTKEKKHKSTLEQLREIREQVSQNLASMTYEERKEWLKRQKPLHAAFQNKDQK
jgi:hypothetical protein